MKWIIDEGSGEIFFAKLEMLICNAKKEYVNDVREERSPTDEHCYHMMKGEEERFRELIKEYK